MHQKVYRLPYSQVAESIARKPVDFGNLIFTDLTTTRCAKSTLARQAAERRYCSVMLGLAPCC